MLKIALKRDEAVCLEHEGKEIKLRVLGYNGSKYVLGFEADKEVKIQREKLREKEDEEALRV